MGAEYLGTDLRKSRRLPCGLCGKSGRLSQTHVPPKSAGNQGSVTRARVHVADQVMGLGRQEIGGVWVAGLCKRCNALAGSRWDESYGRFASALAGWHRAQRNLHLPAGVPAVNFEPGRVTRSVLHGMHALNPHLRVIFPELAASLTSGGGAVSLPPGSQLRVARYTGSVAHLAGAMHAYRVPVRRQRYLAFAEIYFPPLAWVLAPKERGLVFDDESWAVADEWPLYGDDQAGSLHLLTRTFPLVQHPVYSVPNQWVQLFSDETTAIRWGLIQPT